ncbi:hypothetical protein ES705_31778 [subsurface metagenome]
MGKWFRCPVCGRLTLERNLDRDIPVEVFNQVGLGRAKGFRYDHIIDLGIIDRIKNKIRFLYERYFPSIKIGPRVHTVPGILTRAPVPLKPRVLIAPGVRVE